MGASTYPLDLAKGTASTMQALHPLHKKEKLMIEMTLPDMTCGHCAGTVTQTCKLVDQAAKVEVDINARTIKIESSEDQKDFAEALTDAGYPPVH